MTDAADLLGALTELAGGLAHALRTGDEAAARAAAAAQVDQLRQLVAGVERGSPAGGAALLDLARVGDALRVIARALRAPAGAGEAEAEATRAIAELQAAIAPGAGRAPVRDEAAEREHYRQNARAAMDEYFRQHPIKPFKP